MPSSSVDPPEAVWAITDRYHRRERLVSYGFVALATLLGAALVLVIDPLFWGLAAAFVLAAALRVPVLETGGIARLLTDATPETVRESFAGPTPPVLALQWGVADEVTETEDGAVYEFLYLFGLRSTELELTSTDRDDEIELQITVAGNPWATYHVSVDETGDRTAVDVTSESDRRFGLRRLPQWRFGRRYRDPALEAQGYEPVEREFSTSFALRS